MNRSQRRICTVVLFLVSFTLNATVYQAETAHLFKAFNEIKNDGYYGSSYINFDNETGSYIELRIGMAAEGEQSIEIRFANGSTSDRPMQLSVNGNIIGETLLFPPSGSWTNWDTLKLTTYLPAGIHLLRLSSTGSEGGPNIDQIEISGEQLPYYALNLSVIGNGTIQQNPSNGLLFKGQNISLVARAGFSAAFVEWSGDLTSTNDSLNFTIEANQSIEAIFEDIVLDIPEPDFTMTGYASASSDGLSTTTGGAGGKQIIIDNLQKLINWGASREDNSTPEIIIIKGLIEAENTEVITIKRGGNISILGDTSEKGSHGELKNISLNIRDYSNVIIQNIKVHEVFYPNDDLTIDHCHHVWIDHCEFHSKIGDGIGYDTYDGLLDIKKGSHHVSVSWCYFHDHMKTVLIGHSDNNGTQDKDLQITFHHNWFSNTDGRNPSLRFGQIHYYNNFLENISDYGFAVRIGAHAKIENCHFESVKLPIATDKFEGHGYACVSGCIYSGSSAESDNQISDPKDCEFWDDQIPYNYTLENTNTVLLSTKTYAGVGKINSIISSSIVKSINNLAINNLFFSNQKLNVSFNTKLATKLAFTVYSISGKRLYFETRKIETGTHEIKIPLYQLNNGIYFVAIESASERISKKWIKL